MKYLLAIVSVFTFPSLCLASNVNIDLVILNTLGCQADSSGNHVQIWNSELGSFQALADARLTTADFESQANDSTQISNLYFTTGDTTKLSWDYLIHSTGKIGTGYDTFDSNAQAISIKNKLESNQNHVAMIWLDSCAAYLIGDTQSGVVVELSSY